MGVDSRFQVRRCRDKSCVCVGFDSDFFNVARLSSRQKEFLLFFVSGSNLTSFFLLLFFLA